MVLTLEMRYFARHDPISGRYLHHQYPNRIAVQRKLYSLIAILLIEQLPAHLIEYPNLFVPRFAGKIFDVDNITAWSHPQGIGCFPVDLAVFPIPLEMALAFWIIFYLNMPYIARL